MRVTFWRLGVAYLLYRLVFCHRSINSYNCLLSLITNTWLISSSCYLPALWNVLLQFPTSWHVIIQNCKTVSVWVILLNKASEKNWYFCSCFPLSHIGFENSQAFSLEYLQFVLPVTWSFGRKYGITLEQLALWWSERPAKFAGQELKVKQISSICLPIRLTMDSVGKIRQ